MGKFTRKEGENVVRLRSSVQDEVEDDVTIIEDYVTTIEDSLKRNQREERDLKVRNFR